MAFAGKEAAFIFVINVTNGMLSLCSSSSGLLLDCACVCFENVVKLVTRHCSYVSYNSTKQQNTPPIYVLLDNNSRRCI